MAKIKLKEYLGNNFWLLEDNKILHTKSNGIYNYIPAFFDKKHKYIRNYQIYEGSDFIELSEGKRIVIFDFCESIRKHKKTIYVNFLKFRTYDYTYRKYNSIKKNNGFFKFEYGFKVERPYLLLCKVNHEFPDSLHIIEAIEIFKE